MKKFLLYTFLILNAILFLVGMANIIERNEKYITIFVGVITALSGVSAALITNYYNQKSNKERFDHEKLQKESEKIFNLKKDIYLDSSDALIKVQKIMGQIPDPDFDIRKTTESFSQFLYTINRLVMVADIQSVEQSQKVLSACAKLYFLLLKERKALSDLSSELNAIQPFLKVYENEKNRIYQLIQESELSSNLDSKLIKKLWMNYEFNEKKRMDLQDKNLEIMEKSNLEASRLRQIYINNISDVVSEIHRLNALIRQDLTGDYMIEEFENIINESRRNGMEYTNQVIKDLEEHYQNT